MVEQMRAVVHDRYGSADVLELVTLPRPRAGRGQVVVRVAAAGLDRGTWHLMTGKPALVRLAMGVRRPRYRVPGRDVAGTVVEIGPDVTDFAVGDEVYGMGRGTFAEYAAVAVARLARKPTALSFEQAAVVPISGGTALQAVIDAGRVSAGQRVLVTGASGGVGSYAVQLAVAHGARVTGVCSAAKADLVRGLGAERVLDHARQDWASGADRYDLVVDLAGNPSLTRLRRALAPHGTAVLTGGEHGGDITGGLGRQLRALAVSPFVRQRFTVCVARERAADLDRLAPYLEARTVVPALDRTYPLEQAAEAMRLLEAGAVRGKVAITV